MEPGYQGSCQCGEVKYGIEGEFEGFFLCHCKYCQKDTGSAHAANLFSTQAKLLWKSGESLAKTYKIPNTRHVKCFCTQCGASLPYLGENNAYLVVPAGGLDSPIFIKPNAHLFMGSRANWDNELNKLQEFKGLPSE